MKLTWIITASVTDALLQLSAANHTLLWKLFSWKQLIGLFCCCCSSFTFSSVKWQHGLFTKKKKNLMKRGCLKMLGQRIVHSFYSSSSKQTPSDSFRIQKNKTKKDIKGCCHSLVLAAYSGLCKQGNLGCWTFTICSRIPLIYSSRQTDQLRTHLIALLHRKM